MTGNLRFLRVTRAVLEKKGEIGTTPINCGNCLRKLRKAMDESTIVCVSSTVCFSVKFALLHLKKFEVNYVPRDRRSSDFEHLLLCYYYFSQLVRVV